MLHESVLEAIVLELDRLNELLEKYAPLLQKSKTQEPDFIEMASLSVLLHAFYNGLENIFARIARKIDGELPTGPNWHQDLLAQMQRETASRKIVVVSAATAIDLQEYLGFRHFARHAYPLDLEWDLMKDLIERLPELHTRVLGEIGAFVEYLKTVPANG